MGICIRESWCGWVFRVGLKSKEYSVIYQWKMRPEIFAVTFYTLYNYSMKKFIREIIKIFECFNISDIFDLTLFCVTNSPGLGQITLH